MTCKVVKPKKPKVKVTCKVTATSASGLQARASLSRRGITYGRAAGRFSRDGRLGLAMNRRLRRGRYVLTRRPQGHAGGG